MMFASCQNKAEVKTDTVDVECTENQCIDSLNIQSADTLEALPTDTVGIDDPIRKAALKSAKKTVKKTR